VVPGEEPGNDEFVVSTGRTRGGCPAPTALGFDGYFQQRFYAWLIFKNYPSAQSVTLREFYVRFTRAARGDGLRG
jgi:hypothetical protein